MATEPPQLADVGSVEKGSTMPNLQPWPSLSLEEWHDTQTTLHMWMQIIGKVKLELVPFMNEWWNVTFYLTARGMSTGLIPYGDRALEINFDFIDHRVSINADNGDTRSMALEPKSVADFYADFMGLLSDMGFIISINTMPSEVSDPIAFGSNRLNRSYDPDPVNRWWRVQVDTEKVLQRFRSPFLGKSSPIHFFWGSFDLSYTRFSGRPAPSIESAPRFYQLAEDQENIAFGFWPGSTNAAGVTLGEPAFYSYIYPMPSGYASALIEPGAAYFDSDLGEMVLRYSDLQKTDAPEAALLSFFQSTYEAAAKLAGWDRTLLERVALSS